MMIGNIKDYFIRELWQGEKERLLREAHRNGESHRIPACVECSYRAMEIGKLRHFGEIG
jgi:hypothetical protein